MDQVTKKIGAVLPVPRVNKRRPKGLASGIIPWRNRRLAGLSAERRQLGSSRLRKGGMRDLGFDSVGDQMSQQNFNEYAKCFQHPLSQPQIQALSALFGLGLSRGIRLLSRSFYKMVLWILPAFFSGM
jgi:hypothetical protein